MKFETKNLRYNRFLGSTEDTINFVDVEICQSTIIEIFRVTTSKEIYTPYVAESWDEISFLLY